MLKGEGKVLKQGRTTGPVECRITDENGCLVAHATKDLLDSPGDRGSRPLGSSEIVLNEVLRNKSGENSFSGRGR
jgi:hypothetical protein